jgi:iron complex transport system permease protein
MGGRQATRTTDTEAMTSATDMHRSWITPGLCVLIVLAAAIGLRTGAYAVSFDAALSAMGKLITAAPATSPEERVLLVIRGPRVLAGSIVGAALAGAGVVYQGLFRNPLVSPDVLGVSAGAGLGAVLGIFLSLPLVAIQAMAFAGGLATVALVYAVAAAVQGRDATLVLVLGGVVVGALAGAAISLIKILADPYDQLPAITFWLLGSLSSIRSADIGGAMPFVITPVSPPGRPLFRGEASARR